MKVEQSYGIIVLYELPTCSPFQLLHVNVRQISQWQGQGTLVKSYKERSTFLRGCKVRETSNMIMTRKSTESATNVRVREKQVQ